jgi:hypothetical protein
VTSQSKKETGGTKQREKREKYGKRETRERKKREKRTAAPLLPPSVLQCIGHIAR